MSRPNLPDWATQLSRMDEESLATWSSVGLVRRAKRDLENGKVQLLTHEAELEFLADDATTTLVGSDLAKARCTCAAPSGCRHIVACVLWLGSLEAAVPATGTEPSASVPAMDRLREIDPAKVQGRLTPAQRRKAVELAMDPTWRFSNRSETSVGLELERKGWQLRWSPEGPEGTVLSDVPAAQAQIAHAAGILAALRLSGLWQPPQEEATRPPPPALPPDLVPLLRQILSNGIAHAGEHHSTRLRTLAIEVRAQGRRSLASSLRTFASTLETVGTSGSTVSEALLQMAVVLSGCESSRPAVHEEESIRETVECLCLGAHWWESSGGARGASVVFADLTDGSLRSLPLARPDGRDPLFKRDSLWRNLPVWKGTALGSLSGKRLDLASLKVRPDGSWMASESTSVTIRTLPPFDDTAWNLVGTADWNEVRRLMSGLAGSPLVERTHIALRPSKLTLPRLDEVQQIVHLDALDPDGHLLSLEISPNAWNRTRIDLLARFLERGRATVRVVTAVARRSGLRLTLEPTLLVLEQDSKLIAWSPDFEPVPFETASVVSRWIQALRKPVADSAPLLAGAHTTPTTTLQSILLPLLNACEAWAEGGQSARPHHSERLELATALRKQGLAQLGARIESGAAGDDPLEAVRLHHLGRILLELEEWGSVRP